MEDGEVNREIRYLSYDMYSLPEVSVLFIEIKIEF